MTKDQNSKKFIDSVLVTSVGVFAFKAVAQAIIGRLGLEYFKSVWQKISNRLGVKHGNSQGVPQEKSTQED